MIWYHLNGIKKVKKFYKFLKFRILLENEKIDGDFKALCENKFSSLNEYEKNIAEELYNKFGEKIVNEISWLSSMGLLETLYNNIELLEIDDIYLIKNLEKYEIKSINYLSNKTKDWRSIIDLIKSNDFKVLKEPQINLINNLIQYKRISIKFTFVIFMIKSKKYRELEGSKINKIIENNDYDLLAELFKNDKQISQEDINNFLIDIWHINTMNAILEKDPDKALRIYQKALRSYNKTF